MGKQIVKQPNGKYLIFSTVADHVTHYDLTREDVVVLFVEAATEEIEKAVNERIDQLENGGSPYFQFTKNYEEVLKTISLIHGEEEMRRTKSVIENGK